MSKTLKIGIIGLDTSHVEVFARMLNDATDQHHLPGARITVGFPGGSPDFEKSSSRVKLFTEKMVSAYGVEMLGSPEAVAEASDAILLTSVDGRVHLDQFTRIARYGKPTFIDKPLAVTSAHARQIAAVAQQAKVPVMSCSSLRYAESLVKILSDPTKGKPQGADFNGPMPIEPTQKGFFWYGVHSAEGLFTTLGPGCESVQVTRTESDDVAVGLWRDGRIGTMRGFRGREGSFKGVIHYQSKVEMYDYEACVKPAYALMLEKILTFFRTGESPVPISESVEIIRFLEAANESRETGLRVTL